jgi:hypothetical protein
MAVFPRGIKSFIRHKNLIDDVKAEHINDLQDEVVALQEVLGPLVNEVDELNLEMDQNAADDQGALKSNLQKFKNLGDQLLAIRRGTHIPVFQAGLAQVWIPNQQLNPPTVGYRRLTMNILNVDSHKVYNGYGLTLPRTGFYLMRSQVNWDSGTIPVEPGFGTYTGVISVDGNTGWATDRQEHNHSNLRGVHNNMTFLGWAKRGSKVFVGVNQNSDRSVKINSAYLSSTLIRDFS